MERLRFGHNAHFHDIANGQCRDKASPTPRCDTEKSFLELLYAEILVTHFRYFLAFSSFDPTRDANPEKDQCANNQYLWPVD